MNDPVFHKFSVFSVFDNKDSIYEKFSSCNNCGALHKIVDICKSEIVIGAEDGNAVRTIEDIKHSLSENIVSVLETYKCDIATWENVEFIVENNIWEENVVISRESIDDITHIKLLKILSETKIKITSNTIKDTLEIT
tara:strand:+ start:1930 stop:2343 length:414 start_codon:yes stop_codon:yes gene_type:complete